MLDTCELGPRFGAHALRRGIGRHEFGVFRFDGAEFTHQRVVLGVTDGRLVQRVVQVTVVVQEVTQLRGALGSILAHVAPSEGRPSQP